MFLFHNKLAAIDDVDTLGGPDDSATVEVIDAVFVAVSLCLDCTDAGALIENNLFFKNLTLFVSYRKQTAKYRPSTLGFMLQWMVFDNFICWLTGSLMDSSTLDRYFSGAVLGPCIARMAVLSRRFCRHSPVNRCFVILPKLGICRQIIHICGSS